jgi:hypothetical protein
MRKAKKSQEEFDPKTPWKSPQGIGIILTAMAGLIVAVGGIIVPIYQATPKPTLPVPTISVSLNTEPVSISLPLDTVTSRPEPTYTYTPTNTLIPSSTSTSTNTVTNTPTLIPTNTATLPPPPTYTSSPLPKIKKISIEAKTASIELPSWVSDPVRGSITFNDNDEIARTGIITFRLSVRDTQGSRWKESSPKTLITLEPGEKFCSITPAEYNTANYYLGLQAHCYPGSDMCSYNVEGNLLRATIGKVNMVIAPPGVQCP